MLSEVVGWVGECGRGEKGVLTMESCCGCSWVMSLCIHMHGLRFVAFLSFLFPSPSLLFGSGLVGNGIGIVRYVALPGAWCTEVMYLIPEDN
jgi:hypothetical protein